MINIDRGNLKYCLRFTDFSPRRLSEYKPVPWSAVFVSSRWHLVLNLSWKLRWVKNDTATVWTETIPFAPLSKLTITSHFRCTSRQQLEKKSCYNSMQMHFFLFIGREPTTWPANNCLQIMVCSYAISFNCFWLQILFCSCVNETTLAHCSFMWSLSLLLEGSAR